MEIDDLERIVARAKFCQNSLRLRAAFPFGINSPCRAPGVGSKLMFGAAGVWKLARVLIGKAATFQLIFLIGSFAWAGPAQARKVALIIGNSTYANTASLTNPANDAQLVGDAARQAGFDVTMAADLSMATFQRTLRDFRLAADGAEVAMIYYAGHGIEGQGKNWLIPVDAKLQSDYDLPYEAINLDRLFEAVSGSQVRLIVLDACRNNPFGNSWKVGTRSVSGGLAALDIDEILVLFAAAPGQFATDGAQGNSPFATSLAKRLPQPGLAIQMLAGAVRDDVVAATGGKQRPFQNGSMGGTPVYLVKAQEGVAAPSQLIATAGAADPSFEDAIYWQGVSATNTVAGYQAYLNRFPNGIFASNAKSSVARLQTPAQVGAIVATRTVEAVAPAPEPKFFALVMPPPSTPIDPVATAAKETTSNFTNVVEPQVADDSQNYSRVSAQMGGLGTAPLPPIPGAPRFDREGYPHCKDEYKTFSATLQVVAAINRCTTLLDQYYQKDLTSFREAMIQHQVDISKIYKDKIGGRIEFSAASQKQFFDAMNEEHAASNPDGANFVEYREVEDEYKKDRTSMQDRYCFYTGCDGYTAPKFVPEGKK